MKGLILFGPRLVIAVGAIVLIVVAAPILWWLGEDQ